MKKAISLIIILFATVSFAANDKGMNIAVFDAQEVIDNIEEGKQAVARIEKAALAKEKALKDKQKELEKLKKELDSEALVFSKDKLEKKREEFQAKYMEFEKMRMEAQKEFSQLERKETGEIFQKINTLIQKMGKEGDYDLILEKNQGVTYFKSGDITQKVIDQYNKAYSGKKK